MLSGDTIDNYTLLEQIGEGGFGVVYLAQQEKPVRRRVALKIIKVGMDTKQVIARFEAERQALAMMDHPNIAKVLDAGATDTGRPYFVMELVEGERITEYCDRESLTTRDRLDLFTATCRAVQHAHQKGIIHRDLKPSNVLVTVQDGKPVPKVIDFGIAKATAARLTEQTMFTEMGQMVGTPAYMSPEQAGMTTVDIDTRSDVYSLGVLLYELLTGTTPFESIALRRASLAEMQRIIREEEPPRPSVRLSALAALHSQDRRASAPAASATPTVVKTVITGPRSATDVSGSSPTSEVIARMRRTEPRALTRYLRGDLDWIIMKALEKERERRYETANGFAADIERFLEGEPVGAAPPSAAYRMRKFIRRNRAGVTAVALVTVTLVLGVVGTTWGMIAANVQRDRALHAEGEASRRADEFQQVADFQATMLSEIEPAQAGATVMDDILARFGAVLEKQEGDDAERGARAQAFERELRLVNATAVAAAMLDDTVLTPALRTIERDFADQPAVQASLLMTAGNSYRSLGRYEDALARLRWVAQVRERVLGARHPDTLEARSAVGGVLTSLQRLDEAEAELQVVVAESKRLLGADDPQSLRAQAALARLLSKRGRFEECEALCRDTLERRRRLLGDEDQLTIRSKIDLGFLLTARGKFSESEVLLREALETARRVSGEDHPDLIDIYSNLRSALQNLDRPAEAEPFAREAVELSQRILGEDHPLALIHLVNMANLLQVLGRPAEAEPIAREVLERTRRIRGTQHRETLVAMNVVGMTLAMQGRYAEVEPFWRETLAIGRRVLGEDHPDTLTFLNNLSGLLKLLGELSEALELKREALDKSNRVLGEDHPTSLFIAHALAGILEQLDRYDEAESLLRETVEKRTRVLGPDHTGTIDSMVELGKVLLLDGTYVEAEEILQACRDRRARLKGEDHWSTVNAQSLLGATLAGQARFAEAEALLVDSHERLDPPPRGAHLRVNALERIVDLYQAWDAADPGQGYDTKASEWRARLDEARQGDG